MSKKILVIDATYIGNKPNRERNVINMSWWVKERNVDLTIVTTNDAKMFYKELFNSEEFKKIKFIKLPLSKDFNPRGAVGVVTEYLKRVVGIFLFKPNFEKEGYDNIYALSAIFPDVIIAYGLKKKFTGSKVHVVFDNFVKKPSEREGKYFYNLIPYLSYKLSMCFMKKFDIIFTAMVQNNLNKVFKIFNKKRVKIVPDMNGVNLDYINKVGPLEKIYDVLYIGRLHRDKGIIDLLEILGKVKKTLPNIKIFIAGQVVSDIKEKVEEKIDSLGLRNNIKRENHITKLYKYKTLKSSKIFCFFSYYESYPVSILEAMACKLKIFSYDLDVFNQMPFNLGDIEKFTRDDYDVISDKIISYLQNEPHKEKDVDLNLLDQAKSAETQYDNFI